VPQGEHDELLVFGAGDEVREVLVLAEIAVKGSGSNVSVPIMIEQILNKQFPRIGNELKVVNQE
jgi:hypothetical protein